MGYSPAFLRSVSRFERNCGGVPARTALGLKQFHALESKGVRPDQPDQYFLTLLSGKGFWNWILNDIAASYGTFFWPGWLQVRLDFGCERTGFARLWGRSGEWRNLTNCGR